MITNRVKPQFGTLAPPTKHSTTTHLVQSSRFARRLARFLVYGLVASALAMAFLPWQQTSRGTGEVVAYAPQERQQTVQATAKGIIADIADGLVEGKEVEKGEFLLEIQPFAGDMVKQLNGQVQQLKAKEETAQTKADTYAQMVQGYSEARDFAVTAAEEMVEAAEAKLESKKKLAFGYEAKELQAQLQHARQFGLWEKGLKPLKEVEKLKKEWDVAIAELESVRRDVTSLENEVDAKKNELQEKQRLGQTKIDSAAAMEQGALGELATIRKEIGDLKIKLKEMERLTITAPRDGTVFRLNVNEQGDTVKEGDALLTIVPEATQKAVELFVVGNDMPLVELGQEVRLQFEGWPAVQFAGWPSVAVGTFSGIVSTVDATDNGKGEFRILVTPNKDEEQAWPSDRYLRQGVRANGWVMLREVSLGYEIWRQLNGFPVIVSQDEPGKEEKLKTPKLPK